MTSLKAQMGKDAATFFNPSEFGEEINIDGALALGVWDEVAQPAPMFLGSAFDVIGVNSIERVLFIMPVP